MRKLFFALTLFLTISWLSVSLCFASEPLTWSPSIIQKIRKTPEGRQVQIEILSPSTLFLSKAKRLSVRFERSTSPTLFYLNGKKLDLSLIETPSQLDQTIQSYLPKIATKNNFFWIETAFAVDETTNNDAQDVPSSTVALGKVVSAIVDGTLKEDLCKALAIFALECKNSLNKFSDELSTIFESFKAESADSNFGSREQIVKKAKFYERTLSDLEIKQKEGTNLLAILVRINPNETQLTKKAFHQCSCRIDNLDGDACTQSPTRSAETPILACIKQAEALTQGKFRDETNGLIAQVKVLISLSKGLLESFDKLNQPVLPQGSRKNPVSTPVR